MYKLSDVAIKLNIEKVYLFELLMTRSEVLNDHVVKEYGVTYITDIGIRIIDDIINGREIRVDDFEEEKVFEDRNEDIVSDEKIEEYISEDTKKNSTYNIDEDFDNGSDFSIQSDEDQSSVEEYLLNEYEDIELNIDYTIIKEKTRLSFYERETKKKKILELRSKLIELDSEIRRKSEAIESYDKILEEDIQWICILEDKLANKIEQHEEDAHKESNQRNILDKLFMKKWCYIV